MSQDHRSQKMHTQDMQGKEEHTSTANISSVSVVIIGFICCLNPFKGVLEGIRQMEKQI